MAKILILYGTDHGQTRKVAQHIAEILKKADHEIELLAGNKAGADFSLEAFDGVIVGTSIHMDVHQISMRKLVKAHRDAFAQVPRSAHFCVCLTAYSSDPKHQVQVQKYIDDFAKYTGWQARKTVAFAGALKYPDYNFVKRFAAKLLARKLGADTDTKGYYEYTDWDAVTRFAREFSDSLS